MSSQEVTLLSLPYDVRHMIYQHLFPPLHQIYILAGDEGLQLMNNNHVVHTAIFQVNRALNKEASEYFYSKYLFNIVGQKKDCLKFYRQFLTISSKYAREQVLVHPFTNGEHSNTSCISIQAGQSQLKVLQSRRRGKPRTINQIQYEVDASLSRDTTFLQLMLIIKHYGSQPYVQFIVVALLAILPAIVLL